MGRFAYVAFAIDVFSRAIVGWHGSTIKDTDMVVTTLKMAFRRRDQAVTPDPRTHQSGSERPCCSKVRGIHVRSVHGRMGPHRQPLHDRPLKQLADVEKATKNSVHWYNAKRLPQHLGHDPAPTSSRHGF